MSLYIEIQNIFTYYGIVINIIISIIYLNYFIFCFLLYHLIFTALNHVKNVVFVSKQPIIVGINVYTRI